MAAGGEKLVEPRRRRGDRIGRGDADRVKAFAARVGDQRGFDLSRIGQKSRLA
jgi:hypothetical protein